jgi:hypothetical protein
MMKNRPSGWKAVWLGMLATPVLLVATVLLVGVTAGAAGPSTTGASAASASDEVVTHVTALGAGTQTLQQLVDYWTPERMANAKPLPMATSATPTHDAGSVQTIPASSAPLNFVRVNKDGSVSQATASPTSAAQPLTEPFHTAVPFTRWQYFAKYLPNSPGGGSNLAVSAIAKMFFTQNGNNFVCSSSTAGPDAEWTAGHCVADGQGTHTFSTNVLFCPSYDNGVNATAGCWGAESLVTSTVWLNTGDLDEDLGAADVADTGTVNAQQIGSFTGALGFAYVAVAEGTSEAYNANFVSFGYPQGAPFNGNKIQVCTSSLGYQDAATAGGQDSKSIGCDMTGGSSGGPWLIGMGLPGQIGGTPPPGIPNAIFGHNDWRHNAFPNELNSPPYNCLAIAVWRVANDIAPSACP